VPSLIWFWCFQGDRSHLPLESHSLLVIRHKRCVFSSLCLSIFMPYTVQN
jgi:hypothetical protein